MDRYGILILMLLCSLPLAYAETEAKIVNQNISVKVEPSTKLVSIITEDGTRSFDTSLNDTREYQYLTTFIRTFDFQKNTVNEQILNLTSAILDHDNKLGFFASDWVNYAKQAENCKTEKATLTNDFNTCVTSSIKREELDKEKEISTGLRTAINNCQNELEKSKTGSQQPMTNLIIAFISGILVYYGYQKFNWARPSL